MTANESPASSKDPKFNLPLIKEEFKKISWTSKKELYTATKAVLLSTILFGAGIYIVDLVIKAILQMISLLAKKLAS